MAGFDLHQILAKAADDPALVFAQLWVALLDHGFKQASLDSWNENPGHYEQRSSAILVALRGEDALPSNLTNTDALGALRALDELLEEQALGLLPTCRRFVVENTTYWLLARQKGFTPVSARQTNHLQHWAVRHWLCRADVGGIGIQFKHASKEVSDALQALMTRGAVRLYVASFEDGIEPEWADPKPKYRAKALGNLEERWSSVQAALGDAKAQAADVVVLPELTLCGELRDRVADWLESEDHGFCLVVPGSFHVPDGALHRGEAVLLTATGREVLRHHKLAPMRVEGKTIETTVREGISAATELAVLLSPLGPIALAICLDYCEENKPFNDLWEAVAPGLILVPSMSNWKTARAHERRAEELHRKHATVTAVATQPSPAHKSAPRGLVVGRDVNETLRRPRGEAVSATLRFSGKCYRVLLRTLEVRPTMSGVGYA